MSIKDIKAEARRKLALNMHQAIIVYAVEFVIFVTLIALVVMSVMALGNAFKAAAIVMICYGILLGLIAIVAIGMVNFAMVDYYVTSFKCKPYNVRRLGDTLARSGMTTVFRMSVKRTLLGFLLLLCLIVPGVIYLIRTSMANHLLIANPKLKASTSLSASNKVMSGKTGSYFSLCMSMTGWFLLGVATLGLGFIFIMPYLNLIKTVYYKRNLQGDKTVYVYNPQQPLPYAQSTPGTMPTPQPQTYAANDGARVQEQVVNCSASQSQAQQPQVVEVQAERVAVATAPIDTLDPTDVAEMNAAMRDLGDHNVKEVPITVGSSAAKQSETVKEQPAPPEKSDIVVSERTLTTKEVAAANALNKKAADLFADKSAKRSDRDYFTAEGKKSNPNDFVTNEVVLDVEPVQKSDNVIHDERASSVGSDDGHIMSDSEFEEFIRNFDVQKPDSEFKPLVRTPQKDDSAASAEEKDGESRIDKMRREREERLKNLRK